MRNDRPGARPYLVSFLLVSSLFAAIQHAHHEWERQSQEPVALPVTEPVTAAPPAPAVPDFAAIENIEERKTKFFNYLHPHIHAENEAILEQRKVLEGYLLKLRRGEKLERKERAFLSAISEEYELDTLNQASVSHLRQLLRRVDIIPASLVLAQAANESAWGTSRFALEGYNFFGQWCFAEGCGLVPERRHANARHEVQRFGSAKESVHAYFMNINTFQSYHELRRIRQRLRDQSQEIDGLSLAEGLEEYSERGANYVQELRSMIDYNQLLLRDGRQTLASTQF